VHLLFKAMVVEKSSEHTVNEEIALKAVFELG